MTEAPAKASQERILHIKCSEAISLVELLDRQLADPQKTKELIDLGAIYVNRRRQQENIHLVEGDQLRLHLQPRRFPAFANLRLNQTIHRSDDFIVFNKPAGVPVHATLDNAKENLLYWLNTHFHGTDHLVAGRLDNDTSGLVIIATTKKFLRRIHFLLQRHQVGKEYLALTQNPVAPGTYTHYMKRSLRAPKVLLDHEQADALTCKLRVLQTTQLSSGQYRLRIQLITGRTHQIRAQLAHLRAPIVGDALYGESPAGAGAPSLRLQCVRLQFAGQSFSAPELF